MENRDGQLNGATDSRAAGAEGGERVTDVRLTTGDPSTSDSLSASAESRLSGPSVAAAQIDAAQGIEGNQRSGSVTGAGKITCKWCGATNPEGALRCGACGYRFAVRCHACGMTNPKDAANCSYCGESLRLAPFDTIEIARARAAMRVRRMQAVAKGQSSGRLRRGPIPNPPKPLSRLFLLLLVTGGTALALAILIVVLTFMANGGTF